MDFCKICDNMYYIKLLNETCNEITYYCRKCGNEDKDLINKIKSIVKENISGVIENKINFVNKFTKFDRTLPRINYIKCPNSSCITNTKDFNIENKEIIFIRYDNVNMKYLYLCSHCDNSWNTEK